MGVSVQIYTMDMQGKDRFQVSTLPILGADLETIDFCWSPEGDQILYMNNSILYVINADGTGFRSLAEAPVGFTFMEVDWTKVDSSRILARVTGTNLYQSAIVMYDLNGNILQQVVADNPGGLSGPAWSVDGKHMVYAEDVSGFEGEMAAN